MSTSNLVCPICTSVKVEFKFLKNNFGLFNCSLCNVQFIHPLPNDKDLDKTYSDPSYHKESRYETNQQNSAFQKLWEKRLKKINSFGYQSGFLLDIGCATGNFLKIAKAQGWNIAGIEKSSNAAKIAKELLGNDNIHLTDLLTTNFNHQFHTVTAWALIEHVLNPLAYLKKMNDLLIEGGLLAISTPNTHSISRLVKKKKWRYFIPPHHLFYFNPKSIKKVLNLTGFEIIQIKTIFNYHTLFNNESFLNLLYQKKRFYRIWIKIIFYTIKIFSDFFHWGDTMEVYALKK